MKAFLKKGNLGQRGQLWIVDLEDGTRVTSSSLNPVTTCCNKLFDQGVTGDIEFWHEGDPYPSMTGKIEALKNWTTRENDRETVHFVPYSTFFRERDD